VPHVRAQIEAALVDWPLHPHVIEGEEDKFRAFKLATAALAASGTVTLELALTGTPAVVANRVDALAVRLRFLVKVPSIVLANLVLGEKVYPELIQEDCAPKKLASALTPLLSDLAAAQPSARIAGAGAWAPFRRGCQPKRCCRWHCPGLRTLTTHASLRCFLRFRIATTVTTHAPPNSACKPGSRRDRVERRALRAPCKNSRQPRSSIG